MRRRIRQSPSLLRTAHGKRAVALLVAEVSPLDEVPTVDDTEQGLAVAKRRGRPFVKGNSAGSKRPLALATLDVKLGKGDARVSGALKKAQRLRQRRVRELTIQHGGHLSAGVCAMLGSAYRALASSTVLYQLASEAIAKGHTKEGAELFTQSARLADSARQQELTAIAIAEREHASRKNSVAPVDHQAAIRARILGETKP